MRYTKNTRRILLENQGDLTGFVPEIGDVSSFEGQKDAENDQEERDRTCSYDPPDLSPQTTAVHPLV